MLIFAVCVWTNLALLLPGSLSPFSLGDSGESEEVTESEVGPGPGDRGFCVPLRPENPSA